MAEENTKTWTGVSHPATVAVFRTRQQSRCFAPGNTRYRRYHQAAEPFTPAGCLCGSATINELFA
jgi:hypothetical protein